MGLGSSFFVTIFVILLCSCSPCFSRKADDILNLSPRFNWPRKIYPYPSNSSANHSYQVVFNVDDFGAKADANDIDNFQAFKNAWDGACNCSASAKVLVPQAKTYYIKNVTFKGPCRSNIAMEIHGTIRAFPEMYDWPENLWIVFENVENLDVSGGEKGTIDGNGEVWWNHSCRIKNTKPCQDQSAPTALTFDNCTNLRVSNLKMMDAQQMHVNFQDCKQVEASNLLVIAPEYSPNTDGLHFTRASNVRVYDSVIKTGDDCVSMVNGTTNVEMTNITCGPGHGISIGSLGEDNSTNYVSNVHVTESMLIATNNGLRVKTWQGGNGYAKNMLFENIVMKNVSNPIIINQNYCDRHKNCQVQKSGVQIENIVYRNISGTSATEAAITFNCSESVPCKNIILENVRLSGLTQGSKVHAVCNIVNQTWEQNSYPLC